MELEVSTRGPHTKVALLQNDKSSCNSKCTSRVCCWLIFNTWICKVNLLEEQFLFDHVELQLESEFEVSFFPSFDQKLSPSQLHENFHSPTEAFTTVSTNIQGIYPSVVFNTLNHMFQLLYLSCNYMLQLLSLTKWFSSKSQSSMTMFYYKSVRMYDVSYLWSWDDNICNLIHKKSYYKSYRHEIPYDTINTIISGHNIIQSHNNVLWNKQ